MKMTKENWNYCFYKTKDLKAFISMGAHPIDYPDEEIRLIYYVTLSDFLHKEVFQKEFLYLNSAIEFIQKKYGHWEFESLKQSKKTGCESCSAH